MKQVFTFALSGLVALSAPTWSIQPNTDRGGRAALV